MAREADRDAVEFDSEQGLWRDAVREVVGTQSALIREIADKDADPMPLWRIYIELGRLLAAP